MAINCSDDKYWSVVHMSKIYIFVRQTDRVSLMDDGDDDKRKGKQNAEQK